MMPDKIYTNNRGVYAELPVFSQIDANVEYIRKDALLKWAESKHNETDNMDVRTSMRMLIDKLNEM